ncbi:hypothetical protein CKA32_002192 [Geitlerinema sp. FC II]|nr:hypothetical protein CKA32_002192 [Geitlerinema sp. FC II]
MCNTIGTKRESGTADLGIGFFLVFQFLTTHLGLLYALAREAGEL